MSEIIDLTMAEHRMQGALDSVRREFSTIRTGRANPAILDRVEVEVYGARMPLRGVAPFDPGSIKAIERGIGNSDIGLNPQSDGKIIRLPVPELTEERRRQLIRLARGMAEEGRVSVRNVRRDEMRDLMELRKEGEISQDDERRAESELQELTDAYIKRIDAALTDKEAELLEV
jgi:ribosome recycling factor